VKQVPVQPPQLSFNFEQTRSDESSSQTEHSSSRLWRAAAIPMEASEQCSVLSLSAVLRKKQESRTLMLYRQILDSVKHIG
jgi:hypothetical protein